MTKLMSWAQALTCYTNNPETTLLNGIQHMFIAQA